MIRVVIVDDVDLARERVRLYLADEPDIEIVGEAGNGADALRLIAGTAPDLLFLDVGLPDMDGFEIARRRARPTILMRNASVRTGVHAAVEVRQVWRPQ
jgi:DNA-binding NarL/FixJ family response regulator